MKESKLIEMQNKVESQTRVMQQIINELGQTRNIVVSLLEIVKRLKEYKPIIKKLEDEREANSKKAKE
jgi:proteasome assembly chaperone (PAC2) family protein|tara:strand:+ start:281 stop:484 length:204 start_codon:yes stop_codon:yes gene_type:complete